MKIELTAWRAWHSDLPGAWPSRLGPGHWCPREDPGRAVRGRPRTPRAARPASRPCAGCPAPVPDSEDWCWRARGPGPRNSVDKPPACRWWCGWIGWPHWCLHCCPHRVVPAGAPAPVWDRASSAGRGCAAGRRCCRRPQRWPVPPSRPFQDPASCAVPPHCSPRVPGHSARWQCTSRDPAERRAQRAPSSHWHCNG